MRHFLIALTVSLVLAVAGCSSHEVFERNLIYMTAAEFQSQKEFAASRFEQAQRDLAQAQVSGDLARLKAAKAEFDEAKGILKAVEWESRRRQRAW